MWCAPAQGVGLGFHSGYPLGWVYTLNSPRPSVAYICVSKLTIFGLLPERRQAIIWTNARLLSIGPLGTNFGEILSEIHTFSFKKMHLKTSSTKWRPFFRSRRVNQWCLWLRLHAWQTFGCKSSGWCMYNPREPCSFNLQVSTLCGTKSFHPQNTTTTITTTTTTTTTATKCSKMHEELNCDCYMYYVINVFFI